MKIKYNDTPSSLMREYLIEKEVANEYENKLLVCFWVFTDEPYKVYETIVQEGNYYWIDLKNKTVTEETSTLNIKPFHIDIIENGNELQLFNFIVTQWDNITLLDLSTESIAVIQFPYQDVII